MKTNLIRPTANEVFGLTENIMPNSSPSFLQKHLPTIIICSVVLGGVIYIVHKHKKEMEILLGEISKITSTNRSIADMKVSRSNIIPKQKIK